MHCAYDKHKSGRETQQDAVKVFSNGTKSKCLLVLADGMGGHQGGELASKAVLEIAEAVWLEHTSQTINPRKFLQKICLDAHQRINQVGKSYDLSPRSTIVLVYVEHHHAYWAHLGDSRLYHFRGKKLLERTKDHSVVQMLLGLGQITEEQMATHADQGKLLKWLGGEKSHTPDFGEADLQPGDSLVLCSDGLWEYLTPKHIISTLKKYPPEIAVKKLIDDTLNASKGTGDNISVATLQIPGISVGKLHWLALILTSIVASVILGLGLWTFYIPQESNSVVGNPQKARVTNSLGHQTTIN